MIEIPRGTVRPAGAGALTIVLLFFALPAWAGTLCGTVRDAQTQSPVFQAGIFLYDESGTFTGLAASSARVAPSSTA